MHASSELLDIDNVTVAFGAERVLQDVSLCVHDGECIGLIGPNGAGKTTLLRVMLRLLQPTTGQVHRPTVKAGYIPQRNAQYSAIVPISVMEVVQLGAQGSTVQALGALAAAQMQDAAHKRFTELSGGQQQRVAIAKALAAEAKLLILDEPTTGIDERSQAAFYTLLKDLRAQGMTIVMVSHDIDTVLSLVTRVICLNRTVLYDGPPEHFETDKYMPSYYKTRHRQLHHHHEAEHV